MTTQLNKLGGQSKRVLATINNGCVQRYEEGPKPIFSFAAPWFVGLSPLYKVYIQYDPANPKAPAEIFNREVGRRAYFCGLAEGKQMPRRYAKGEFMGLAEYMEPLPYSRSFQIPPWHPGQNEDLCPVSFTLTFPPELAQAIHANAFSQGETVQSFIIASVRQRLRFFDVKVDPKFATNRSLQAVLDQWSKQEVNRLLDNRSWVELVFGNDLYDRLEEIGKSAGMSVEELLISIMRDRLLDASITMDDDWIIKKAALQVPLLVSNRDAKGGAK